jgi:hypothetical protein
MEDLAPFFAGLDAKELTFHTDSGNRIVTGYFDNAFFNSQIGETILDTTQPRLTVVYSEVSDIPRETMVTVDGKLHSIIQIQPEGTGMATITLAIEPNTLG